MSNQFTLILIINFFSILNYVRLDLGKKILPENTSSNLPSILAIEKSGN